MLRNEEPHKAKRAAIIAVCFAGTKYMFICSNDLCSHESPVLFWHSKNSLYASILGQ